VPLTLLWYSAVKRVDRRDFLSPSFLRLVEVIGAGHSNWVVAFNFGGGERLMDKSPMRLRNFAWQGNKSMIRSKSLHGKAISP